MTVNILVDRLGRPRMLSFQYVQSFKTFMALAYTIEIAKWGSLGESRFALLRGFAVAE